MPALASRVNVKLASLFPDDAERTEVKRKLLGLSDTQLEMFFDSKDAVIKDLLRHSGPPSSDWVATMEEVLDSKLKEKFERQTEVLIANQKKVLERQLEMHHQELEDEFDKRKEEMYRDPGGALYEAIARGTLFLINFATFKLRLPGWLFT